MNLQNGRVRIGSISRTKKYQILAFFIISVLIVLNRGGSSLDGNKEKISEDSEENKNFMDIAKRRGKSTKHQQMIITD